MFDFTEFLCVRASHAQKPFAMPSDAENVQEAEHEKRSRYVSTSSVYCRRVSPSISDSLQLIPPMRSRDEELSFELKPLAATVRVFIYPLSQWRMMPRALGRPMKLLPMDNESGTCGLVQGRHPQANLVRIVVGAIDNAEGLWKVCRPLHAKVGRTRSATADEQCNKDKDRITVQTLDNSIEKAVQKILRTLPPCGGLTCDVCRC
ncbi:hypothetical protein E4U40_002013 [Claviceps sp. LM458 group G5]|nr:hypothetical protein E4U40_002013 [Claviceps sp. LM458 group G5]